MSASLIPRFKTLRETRENICHKLIRGTSGKTQAQLPNKKVKEAVDPCSGSDGEGQAYVKKMNRSHRAGHLVLLLMFAVALTTALVLAGERKSESGKKNTRFGARSNAMSAQVRMESCACELA